MFYNFLNKNKICSRTWLYNTITNGNIVSVFVFMILLGNARI